MSRIPRLPPLAGLPFCLALSCCAPRDVRHEGDAPDTAADVDDGVIPVDQDVLTTDLRLDLSARTGVATLLVQPAPTADAVVLDVSGLSVTGATIDESSVDVASRAGLARFPVARSDRPVHLVVRYGFPVREETFDGWMPSLGVSFTWPFFCGALFPCNPSPHDGVRFTMDVTGMPEGQSALYPRDTVGDAPPYLPAIALGSFAQLSLGTTAAGTSVSAWYPPTLVDETTARAGTAHLLQVQDFFEQRYGPYAFGPALGAVAVDWGEDSWGGIETQPFYHVPKFDFGTEEVHAHEAAHAWFGNGVRFACWEDFVLSEGTVTYMAARGLQKTNGPDPWPMYVDILQDICEGNYGNAVVLQDSSCNQIDFLNEWSLVHYMKGACFYEDVADTLGWETLDDVLRDFYVEHVGTAARMEEMLDALKSRAPEQSQRIDDLAEAWLRRLSCPTDFAQRCGTHAE
jgi:aminopeptidase N